MVWSGGLAFKKYFLHPKTGIFDIEPDDFTGFSDVLYNNDLLIISPFPNCTLRLHG